MHNKQSELLNSTLHLVRNRPRHLTYKVISNDTGLPIQFLQDLMGSRIKSPGVTRIETLYNYFASAPLAIHREQCVYCTP
jgi:hypothetical protein